MNRAKIRTTSLWPAIALAILTFLVFASLQNFGPESTIRRFHVAIANRDIKLLQSTLAQDVSNQDVAELIGWTRPLLQSGYSYRIQRMDRQPSEVRAAVLYSRPRSFSQARIWVVERRGRQWIIDASKSARILRDALGL